MLIKCYCEGCEKMRETNCQMVNRGDERWFQGCCSYCGTWWFKKVKQNSDKNPETGKHPPMEWYLDYLKEEKESHWRGHINRSKDWKGVKGDDKIRSN